MTFNYPKSRSTARRLIAKFGQDATIRRIANSGTAYDPTRTPADHAVKIVVLEYTERETDGTLIRIGDKKVLISTDGLSIEPQPGDTLIIGGVNHAVVDVDPLNPGGTVIMWQAQARK